MRLFKVKVKALCVDERLDSRQVYGPLLLLLSLPVDNVYCTALRVLLVAPLALDSSGYSALSSTRASGTTFTKPVYLQTTPPPG